MTQACQKQCESHLSCKKEPKFFPSNDKALERDDFLQPARKQHDRMRFGLPSEAGPKFRSQSQGNAVVDPLACLRKGQFYTDPYQWDQPRESSQKTVVTDFALDHWCCQLYSLDLCQWPRKKPESMQKEVYEGLQKTLKQSFRVQSEDRPEVKIIKAVKEIARQNMG